jgi:hypothetical protein
MIGNIRRAFVTSSWRFKSGIVLAIAVVTGSVLRFFRLGSRELSIDESLSWAAASAPTMSELFSVQTRVDSGKLAVHEIALRVWMQKFGDSEAAMRALSAVIGSISIVLVFILAREIASSMNSKSSDRDGDHQESSARNERGAWMIPALAALVFAVGLSVVEIAREARMYSMMLALIIAQAIFMLRAKRKGGLANYAGFSIFTALAVATNFTALLVLASEAMWLGYLSLMSWRKTRPPSLAFVWRMAAAIVFAMLLLTPFFSGLLNGVVGMQRGDFDWIRPPGRWEPFATFESGIGTWPFAVFVIFSIAGAVRLWKTSRDEAVLALLWIWIPPIALLVGSYFFFPMLVTRYVIASFVPLFVLTAVGVASMPRSGAVAMAMLAIVGLSIGRDWSELRPGDDRWRQASAVALAHAGRDRRIGACHDFYLVSYYLPAQERGSVQVIRVPTRGPAEKDPRVVIVSPTVAKPRVDELRREYPEVDGNYKNILVLSRPPGVN